MAALASAFNFAVLNLVLLVAALPVITLPAAISAASVALDRWRNEGEDRVIREFVTALRRTPLRTTAAAGVPLAAAVLGVAEIRYFLRGGSLADRLGLGLGLGALVITLTALGYVFLLAARRPGLPPGELWSLSARLAVRNLLVTGPLFLAEIAAAAALTLIDPPLLLLGVPVLLLFVMQRTAQLGLRRAGLSGPGRP
jgi:hypothetical protein